MSPQLHLSPQDEANDILARWTIKVVCGWCGKLMHEGPPMPVSHGLCPSCAAKLERRETA